MSKKAKIKELLNHVEEILTNIPDKMVRLVQRAGILRRDIQLLNSFFTRDERIKTLSNEVEALKILVDDSIDLNKIFSDTASNVNNLKISVTNKAKLDNFTAFVKWIEDAREKYKKDIQMCKAEDIRSQNEILAKKNILETTDIKIKKITHLIYLINQLTDCVEEFGLIEQLIPICTDVDNLLSKLPVIDKAKELDSSAINELEQAIQKINNTVESSSAEITRKFVFIDLWIAGLEKINTPSINTYKQKRRELADDHKSGEVVGLNEKTAELLSDIYKAITRFRYEKQSKTQLLFTEFRENCSINPELEKLHEKLVEPIKTPDELEQWIESSRHFNVEFDRELGYENDDLLANLEKQLSNLSEKITQIENIRKSAENQQKLSVLKKQASEIENSEIENQKMENASKRILKSLIAIKELISNLNELEETIIKEGDKYQIGCDETTEIAQILRKNQKEFYAEIKAEEQLSLIDIDINRLNKIIDYGYLEGINKNLEEEISKLCSEGDEYTLKITKDVQEIEDVLIQLNIEIPKVMLEFEEKNVYFPEILTFFEKNAIYHSLIEVIELADEQFQKRITATQAQLLRHRNNTSLDQFDIDEIDSQIKHLSAWEKMPSLVDKGLLNLFCILQDADNIIERHAAIENNVKNLLNRLEKKLELYESAFPGTTTIFFLDIKLYVSGLIRGCDLRTEQWALCEQQLEKAEGLLSQLEAMSEGITLQNLNENLGKLSSNMHRMDSSSSLFQESEEILDTINEKHKNSLPSKQLIQKMENIILKTG